MSAGVPGQPAGDAAVCAGSTLECILRAALTRRLERLLVRVNATPERVVERKKTLLFGLDVRGPVRVRVDAIWVFGIYFREGTLAVSGLTRRLQSFWHFRAEGIPNGRCLSLTSRSTWSWPDRSSELKECFSPSHDGCLVPCIALH